MIVLEIIGDARTVGFDASRTENVALANALVDAMTFDCAQTYKQ